MSFQQAPPHVEGLALPYGVPGHPSGASGLSAFENANGRAAPLGGLAGAESPFDRQIRTNIQTIRTNLMAIEENLGNLNRRFVSRRIVESLHDRLRETYDIVLATERLFKAWQAEQQEQAIDALERQRRRFLYEKLSAHFQEEIKKVQAISERVREAAERVADSGASSLPSETGGYTAAGHTDAADFARPATATAVSPAPPAGASRRWREERGERSGLHMTAAAAHASHGGPSTELAKKPGRGNANSSNGVVLDLENVALMGEDERDEFFIGDDEQEMCNELEDVAEHESLLQRTVAEERFQGLQRIHGQVKQANQIFKDLAQLVLQQDTGIESIETQMQSAHNQIKGAASELYKAHQMHRRSRQRRCLLLLLVFAVVSFLFYFYSSLSAVHGPAPAASSDAVMALSQPSSLSATLRAGLESAALEDQEARKGEHGAAAPAQPGAGGGPLPVGGAADSQGIFGTRFSLGHAVDRVVESASMGASGPGVVMPTALGGASVERGFRPQTPN
ncbi:SNARE domain-containing protein [Besnoitia besnoiti]|uniref:SNARE domain-containing protein n=1 Tax=Besnoitia besnoiti TaxID=94643 RepID=A0A2A9MFW3_BESBE|nr:SNARE domain-containing protein [Besnoitia besnoiti]PFH34487.1 SNARE domain-containing protein [Besnoitia besnoiti]